MEATDGATTPRVRESITFEGKTVALYSEKQLANLSRANLKQRAMNMRDAMGSLGLRHLRMSSQPEALVSWLLEVQSIMVAAADAAAPSAPYVPSLPMGGYPGELDLHGDGFTDQGNPMRDWMPPPNPHEEAVAGAQAARLRNAGSFTFGHEPGLGSMPPPPSSRGGRGAVVGQEGAYSTGRNPITGGPGEWGGGSDMWARPTSARIRQVGASDVGHGPGMHRPASPGAASHCSDVSHRQAHEDSLAGAHAARIRNQGSFAFG